MAQIDSVEVLVHEATSGLVRRLWHCHVHLLLGSRPRELIAGFLKTMGHCIIPCRVASCMATPNLLLLCDPVC